MIFLFKILLIQAFKKSFKINALQKTTQYILFFNLFLTKYKIKNKDEKKPAKKAGFVCSKFVIFYFCVGI